MAVVEGLSGSGDAGLRSESRGLDALAIDQPSRLFKRGIACGSCISQSWRRATCVEKTIAKWPPATSMRAPPNRGRPAQRMAVLHETRCMQHRPQSPSRDCMVHQKHPGAMQQAVNCELSLRTCWSFCIRRVMQQVALRTQQPLASTHNDQVVGHADCATNARDMSPLRLDGERACQLTQSEQSPQPCMFVSEHARVPGAHSSAACWGYRSCFQRSTGTPETLTARQT